MGQEHQTSIALAGISLAALKHFSQMTLLCWISFIIISAVHTDIFT